MSCDWGRCADEVGRVVEPICGKASKITQTIPRVNLSGKVRLCRASELHATSPLFHRGSATSTELLGSRLASKVSYVRASKHSQYFQFAPITASAQVTKCVVWGCSVHL